MNRLPIFLFLLFGLSACGLTQTKLPNESSNSNTAPDGSKIQDLIIGKWRLTETRKRRTKDGPLEIDTLPDSVEVNIEYLKDNTSLHTHKEANIDDIERASETIKNEKWRVLSDETIEITYDYCQTRTQPTEKCERQTEVNKIIFPDSDTLLNFGSIDRTDVGAYSEYVEKFSVYKRIN